MRTCNGIVEVHKMLIGSFFSPERIEPAFMNSHGICLYNSNKSWPALWVILMDPLIYYNDGPSELYDYREQHGTHRIFDIVEEKPHFWKLMAYPESTTRTTYRPVVRDNQIYITNKISLQNGDVNFLPSHRFFCLEEERPHFWKRLSYLESRITTT